MNEIDWNEAPEGYPVWVEDLMHGEKSHGWHKEKDGRWVDPLGRYWEKSAAERGNCRAHYKPEPTPSWSGEGLPPVGVECEAKWGRNGWSRCVVFAHKPNASGGTDVLVDVDGDWTFFDKPSMFRPLRTPEQIAADERVAAVDEMVKSCPYPASTSTRLDCAALYDAGYRKP